MRAISVVALVAVVCVLVPSCAGRKSAAPAPVAIEQPAQQFVELLAKADFQTATQRFDDTMRQALPADKLQQAWDSLVQQFGAFERIASARTAQEQGYDVAYVRCEFANGAVEAKVVFDQNQRISGLWFNPAT
jgi:hypothetical protein